MHGAGSHYGNRFAVDVNFDIVIQIITGIAIAMEADIARLDPLGIDKFTLGGLHIVQILPYAQTG